jgi:hypothetical protein
MVLATGRTQTPLRVVSLPGCGRCQVLVTLNASTDPRAESLKVVVTGFRRDAETLLEFLSRDALRAANSVAGFQPLAEKLLQKKFDDPIAAVAGAYFLLRTKGWSRVPVSWFDNLTDSVRWLPDAPIIRCIVMLRSGLPSNGGRAKARELLGECLNRGVPIFAEGLSLLQEAASLLRKRSDHRGVYGAVEKLATSQAWAGAAFSYYAEDPGAPSPVEVFGTPVVGRTAQRRQKDKKSARPTSPTKPYLTFLDKL